MSIANPTPEEQSRWAKEQADNSLRISPVNNGFIVWTHRGKFVFTSLKEVMSFTEDFYKGSKRP